MLYISNYSCGAGRPVRGRCGDRSAIQGRISGFRAAINRARRLGGRRTGQPRAGGDAGRAGGEGAGERGGVGAEGAPRAGEGVEGASFRVFSDL